MRITLGNDSSLSPKAVGSSQTINDAERIRLEGKISLLSMRNDILAKQVEKYKTSNVLLSEYESVAKGHSEHNKKTE